MAKLNLKHNLSDIEPVSFDPIPEGVYIAQIVKSEMKDTKAGGEMLVLQFQILAPTHNGRMVFERLNLVNDNPKAEEIAYRKLAAICEAINHGPQVTDSETLHGKPMQIGVTITPAQGQYGPDNKINSFEVAPKVQVQQAAPVQQAPVQQPAQQPIQGTPPGWGSN